MKRNGAGDEPRPELRIAGYVQGHAEPVADPDPYAPPPAAAPGRLPVNLPNISDYWPDAGRQPAPAPAGPGAPAALTATRNRRPAVLATVLALVVAVGTFLLSRPLTGPEERRPVAAAPTTVVPVSVAPSESPAEPPPVPATTAPATTAPATTAPATTAPATTAPATTAPTTVPPKPPAPITAARFELVTGVTELSVRTADLDGDTFRVSTPGDSGLDVNARFDDGVLRVRTEPDGSGSGSGRVNVLLSEDVVWRLRMGAGVHTASFDMSGGTVGDIDLIGGAQTVDIELGRLDGTLPILMAGGVHTWRISTAEKVPVQVRLGSGTGGLTVYGDDKGGVSGGTTIRDGDPDGRPGLDIDAEAGIGSLRISRD